VNPERVNEMKDPIGLVISYNKGDSTQRSFDFALRFASGFAQDDSLDEDPFTPLTPLGRRFVQDNSTGLTA